MGIHCEHYSYIEQKDCTAGLDAGGIWKIPYTKVNQVYSGEGPSRCTYSMVTPSLRRQMDKYIFGKNTNLYFDEHLFFSRQKFANLQKFQSWLFFAKQVYVCPAVQKIPCSFYGKSRLTHSSENQKNYSFKIIYWEFWLNIITFRKYM